jgi:hypothetical protein
MNHIEEFICLIKNALKNIEKKYYKFPTFTDSGKKYITRERVFCYELYHQMRTIQKENDKNDENYKLKKLTLNGEPDKSGHQYIQNALNPDFIFHIPGTMDNFAVIEVKGYDHQKSLIKNDLCKDLCKLTEFVQNNGYEYGIMLIFNYSIEKAIPVIQEIVKESCFCLQNDQDIRNKLFILCTPRNCSLESKSLSEIFKPK